MTSGIARCQKCGSDYGTLEHRACCGLLWATCSRCGFEWLQTPLDAQAPAPRALFPFSEGSAGLMESLRSLYPFQESTPAGVEQDVVAPAMAPLSPTNDAAPTAGVDAVPPTGEGEP
jgi:hypothetical protein